MAAAGGAAAEIEAAPLPEGAAEDLDGLPVSAKFIEELEAFDLASAHAAQGRWEEALDLAGGERIESGPAAMIVQVSPRKTPLPEVEKVAERFDACVRCLHIEPFWQPLEPGELGPLAECLEEFLLGEEK